MIDSDEDEGGIVAIRRGGTAKSPPTTTPDSIKASSTNSSSIPSTSPHQLPQLHPLTPIPALPSPAAVAAPLPSLDLSSIGGLRRELDELYTCLTIPLLHPELCTAFGVRPLKGVLLHGPPGTGKTLIARTVAKQAMAKFYVVNGPEIISKNVGESEEKLVALFAEARRNAPSIIFLDELDALAPKREEQQDEMAKRIVAALLTLMDGLSNSNTATSDDDESRATSALSDRVVVIGATNRPDALDTALRRSGRFDREIEIGIPNERDRMDILRKMIADKPTTVTEDELTYIASITHGYVGADLKALVQEATGLALDRWERTTSDLANFSTLRLTSEDFLNAKPNVKASAMRSLQIDVPKVKWEDIGGQEEVKQKLKEAVEWPLTNPEAFLRLGISPPKGILLYGPPGCSKTLMAKALATSSSRNFISVKGPELFSKWVGESEKAVKEIFRKARAAAPSIIFFDEIDAIAVKRDSSGSEGGGEAVAVRVVSQLLSELDGIEPLRQVTVLAATNRPDLIDPALLRPGRIDRKLYVGLPHGASILAILRIEQRRIGLAAAEVDMSKVAEQCEGLSGAELIAVSREAGLAALAQAVEIQQRAEGIPAPCTLADLQTHPSANWSRLPSSSLECIRTYLSRHDQLIHFAPTCRSYRSCVQLARMHLLTVDHFLEGRRHVHPRIDEAVYRAYGKATGLDDA